MNRRDFLQTGAAAAATLGIPARSYAAIAGANDRVRLGVIGLGRRAEVVCGGGFTQDPRVQIVAVSDVYGQKTATFQSRFSLNLSASDVLVDFHPMLDRKDVDAIFVATPDHLHVQLATAVLGAGKHIYLEKPTLHRWQEREALVNAAAKSRTVLQCGTQQRSGAHYVHAKQEFFDSGKLGDVVFVRAVWSNFPWQRRVIPNEPKPADLNWNLFLGPAPKVPYETARYSSWRSYHDYGNGVLADILTHWVDVAQWMLNDDQPVNAVAFGGDYQLHDDRDNPDTVSAVLKYKNWILNFESFVLSLRNPTPSVLFQGTKGSLDLSRSGYTYMPLEGEPVKFKSDENLELAHTKNFIDAVLNGGTPSAPLSAGMSATVPVQMALLSYWSHKIVTRQDLG